MQVHVFSSIKPYWNCIEKTWLYEAPILYSIIGFVYDLWDQKLMWPVSQSAKDQFTILFRILRNIYMNTQTCMFSTWKKFMIDAASLPKIIDKLQFYIQSSIHLHVQELKIFV